MAKTSPMMKQYYRIKERNKDAVLLFRLGDFYEMFEGDALEASRILGITLTKRNGIPMCGFPHHAAHNYISKFLENGRKIAVCEQTSDPARTKGIVSREVVEVISPGIITNPEFLHKDSNAIASIAGHSGGEPGFACACLDISTGEFVSRYFKNGDAADHLIGEFDDNGVREVLYPSSWREEGCAFQIMIGKIGEIRPDIVMRSFEDRFFDIDTAGEALKEIFSLESLSAFEFGNPLEAGACGALLSYLRENTHDLSHVKWPREKRGEDALFIDSATKRHLELTENTEGGRNATLLAVLDQTKTAMGARLLRKFIGSPSVKREEIQGRLDKVECLLENSTLHGTVQQHLGAVPDMERIITKLSVGKGNARDLLGLKTSLVSAGCIAADLTRVELFSEDAGSINPLPDIVELIERAFVEDPPLSVREGKIIRSGYSEKLDEYRRVNRENREWINGYQLKLQEDLGVSSLKVKYNRIIGYYIDVTKPNLHLVPGNFIRKQTLVGSERFTTEKLQEHETLLAEARQNGDELEFEIFEDVRKRVLEKMRELYINAEILARIDVICSFSSAAVENGYVKPVMLDEGLIDIRDGRHPVVERFGDEAFIGNDLFLDGESSRVMILTGPNMAGKSTYLRQVAIIIIMAHIGSFVPAADARIGIVDRVFSRIGASDRLVRGESTFLVEMIETARILRYAGRRSFIIMDEIGRGTSTYDGLAIAWAVLEFLLEGKTGAKVLFATHYHELTALRDRPGVVNCNVTVKEWNNSVIFLRKVVPGSASRSYGIEVAKMAGIPERVVRRAKSILAALETKYGSMRLLMEEAETEDEAKEDTTEQSDTDTTLRESSQYELFPSPLELMEELKNLEIENLTPLQALNILDRLKKSVST